MAQILKIIAFKKHLRLGGLYQFKDTINYKKYLNNVCIAKMRIKYYYKYGYMAVKKHINLILKW
jgi:hypothetical protein